MHNRAGLIRKWEARFGVKIVPNPKIGPGDATISPFPFPAAIHINPELLLLPDQQLAQILAHEMGHRHDPLFTVVVCAMLIGFVLGLGSFLATFAVHSPILHWLPSAGIGIVIAAVLARIFLYDTLERRADRWVEQNPLRHHLG